MIAEPYAAPGNLPSLQQWLLNTGGSGGDIESAKTQNRKMAELTQLLGLHTVVRKREFADNTCMTETAELQVSRTLGCTDWADAHKATNEVEYLSFFRHPLNS